MVSIGLKSSQIADSLSSLKSGSLLIQTAGPRGPVVADQSLAIDENQPSGTAAGLIEVSNLKPKDSVTYGLLDDAGGRFAIDSATGEISTTAPLDHESVDVHSLIVEVTDQRGRSDTATITISVGDVNEAPLASNADLAVYENQPAGAAVGSVVASDPDDAAEPFGTLSYAITGGNAAGLFAIDPASGAITTTAPLDHETAPGHALTVTVTDGAGLSDTATVTVNVDDVNEAPQASGAVFAVAENQAAGTVVGSVVASDPDDAAEPFGTLSYAITGGNAAGLFAIDPASGAITTTAPLDHEAAASHVLTITATDGGGLSESATVTVSVGDRNEAPLASDAVLAVDEAQPAGAAVGTAPASDPDDSAEPFGTLSFTITGGNAAGLFAIDPASGAITTTATLDRQAAASHGLSVTVTDGAGLSDTATVTVNVNDVNETPEASDAVYSVDELQLPGTVVGTVSASDPDDPAGPFGSLSYAITGGNAAGLFAIDPDVGTITTTRFLDHEAADNHALTVTVSDGGGLSDTAAVTVNIGDLNEVPSLFNASFSVLENQPAGTTVGTVSASDPDDPAEPFGTLTFAITGGNEAGLFAIDSAIGEITTTAPLDREATLLHTLNVTATDGGGLSSAASIWVEVGDLPDGPSPFVLLSELDGSNGFAISDSGLSGTTADLGRAVSVVGDFDSDGLADFMIGAPSAEVGGELSVGKGYFVFGDTRGFPAEFDLATLSGGNGFRIDGLDFGDELAVSLSSAGDVNGDGAGDIIVGADNVDVPGASQAGASYVLFFSAAGLPPVYDLATLNGTNGFRLDGAGAYDHSGGSVSGGGDVNGDGFDDLIVGAFAADTGYYSYYGGSSYGGIQAGSTYVVFGQAGGFAPSMNLAALNGTNGFRIDGVAERDHAGFSVANAADVNGDGFDDVVIGTDSDLYSSGINQAYVVFGHDGTFPASMDLAGLDGTNGFVIDGIVAGDQAGFSVAGAGDVNGDGFADVVIGAPQYTFLGPAGTGEAYVVFGTPSGFASVLDLTSLDGTNGFRTTGLEIGDRVGSSVNAAGDLNGDGFDDLLVGAPGVIGDSSGGIYGYYAAPGGQVYVVFGRADGFASSFDIAAVDGINGVRIQPATGTQSLGQSVSGGGDIDGDGFDDMILGAQGASYGGSPGGFVVLGRDFSGTVVTHLGTAAADTLTGTASSDVMVAAQGNDVLQGAGGDDVLTGALGADRFVFTNGSGNDKVTDFQAGEFFEDVIDIADFGFTDLASVLGQSTQVGSNLVISLDADDSLTLVGINASDLVPDDFVLF